MYRWGDTQYGRSIDSKQMEKERAVSSRDNVLLAMVTAAGRKSVAVAGVSSGTSPSTGQKASLRVIKWSYRLAANGKGLVGCSHTNELAL